MDNIKEKANETFTNNIDYDSDTTIDSDLSDIMRKFRDVEKKTNDLAEVICIDDDLNSIDEDIPDMYEINERLRLKYGLVTSPTMKSYSTDMQASQAFDDLPTPKHCNNEDLDLLSDDAPKPKKLKSKDNVKKTQKEIEKAQKQAERERIKAENAKAKAEKQALALAFKNIKPETCIKLITTQIDTDLMSSECGSEIPSALQAADIAYKVKSNLHSFTIDWTRKTQSQLTTTNGEWQLGKNEDYCDNTIFFLNWKVLVNLVHEKTLCSYFETKKSLMPKKKLYLIIYGLENYYRFHQNKQKKSTNNKAYENTPKVTKNDVEMALIELQLVFGISHIFTETPQDVAKLVVHFTKAVAQIPYKLQKELKHQEMDWFVSGDNKDCVRVNSTGNGLARLWQQQITQFPLARLELAEAITSKYPSPSSLMQAYKECTTLQEAEKLLQDIPIRRAAGPLTSVRKIGPEFSKKVYTFFNSTEGYEIL